MSNTDAALDQQESIIGKKNDVAAQHRNPILVIKHFPTHLQRKKKKTMNNRSMARLKLGPDGRMHRARLDPPQASDALKVAAQPAQNDATATVIAYPQEEAALSNQEEIATDEFENPFATSHNDYPVAMPESEFLESLQPSPLPLQGLTGAHRVAHAARVGLPRPPPTLALAVPPSVLSPAFSPAMFATQFPFTTELAIPQESSVTFSEVPYREPMCLYLECDDVNLSSYQCLIRKQIEFFQATQQEIDATAQGRNTPIVMGQVGIRCRHCAIHSPIHRRAGAVYFPRRVSPKIVV